MADATLTKRDGVVSMDKSFDFLCSTLRNGVYTVKIIRKTEPRTISQNSLMWMWYKCMEEATGTPKEDFHDYYKAKYLSREVVVGQKWYRVTGSTTELNTLQMTNFLNKVQADAAIEFGINLPLPSDRHFQSFVSEYKNR
ncbi:MAG: hypothetical protein HDR81_09335 [Bacteroides sp.]|nr:hypothetical protein [Bacteroides sp.]